MSSTTLYARQEHNRNSQLFVVIVRGDGAVFNLFFPDFFHKYLVALWSDNLEIFFCWVDGRGSLCTADLLLSLTVYFLMAAYKAQLHCLRAAVSPCFFSPNKTSVWFLYPNLRCIATGTYENRHVLIDPSSSSSCVCSDVWLRITTEHFLLL